MQTILEFNPLLYNVAKIKIHYSTNVKASDRLHVSSSKDAHTIFMAFWKAEESIEHRESFKILLLNRSNKVLGISNISEGGISGTIADPKIIFQTALIGNASSIVLAHNHPSGNLKPSEADRQITNKLKEAGKFLDLPIIDHIILIPDESKYFSFADDGLL